jgi:hypothetical protein
VKQLVPEERQEILDDLDRYFARIDAKRRPVSEEEADAIINEALRSTRPDYRPITENCRRGSAKSGLTGPWQ